MGLSIENCLFENFCLRRLLYWQIVLWENVERFQVVLEVADAHVDAVVL